MGNVAGRLQISRIAIDTEGDNRIRVLVADDQKGARRINRKVPRRFALSIGMAKSRNCLLYTSPSPRDRQKSRMPSSA